MMNKFLILGRRIFFEFTQKRFSLVCTHFVLSLCKNSNCWEIPLSFLSSPELITILVGYWSFHTFTYQDKSDNHTPPILFCSQWLQIFSTTTTCESWMFEVYNNFHFLKNSAAIRLHILRSLSASGSYLVGLPLICS